MEILTVILILIIFILAGVLWKYTRQIKSICRQLVFLEKHESNMMISGDIRYGGMGELEERLNSLIARQKEEQVRWQERVKMIARTYTSLSHDIRTPLTSLDGYVQLLEKSRDEKERAGYLRIIRERIGSLKEMLEELFLYTKLKNGAYELPREECSLNRILKETVFSYYNDWLERQIQPEFEITEKEIRIQGNPQGLKRVFQNIIKNGLDHGQKRIWISLTEEEGAARLCFENEVEHPEALDVSQVFEEFYRADEARSRNSTGLGLSIAKEFVLRMGGEIRADIEGNRFRVEIYFPLEPVSKGHPEEKF